MKRLSVFIVTLLTLHFASANTKDSVITYPFHDSLKASGFMAFVNVKQVNTKKEVFAGIQIGDVKLSLESDKNQRAIVFSFPQKAIVAAKGIEIDNSEKREMEWGYNWNLNFTYQLYIATATDSAQNFTLYSGYIFIQDQNKWKLIGSCKIEGHWGLVKKASTFYTSNKKALLSVDFEQVWAWAQRRNGSWENMLSNNFKKPVIAPFRDIDSLQQTKQEERMIQAAIASGKTDTKSSHENVYYKIMKEGTGRQVLVSDTVVVFYKGYLLEDGSIFDETKGKPATFPLAGLIRGWQLGLTECKVGGKIKLVIPSGLAYSIRTRSPKIPPNSILVFEIEVVDVK